MQGIRISFVIPSFRQGRFIGRTLDAILEQRLPREQYEVIVMDGGSDDGTVEILKTHPVAPTWVSRPDKGQSDAINQGLSLAAGEIIAWINSDDVYRPDALRRVLAEFDTHSEVEALYGHAELIDEQGARLGSYPVEPWRYERLADTCFLCQPAVFFRRSVIAKYGVLDERLHYAMDYEYWLRIGKDSPFLFVDAVLAASRIYADTKTLRDKRGVFREGMEVSRRHMGRWSREWARGYGYWRAKALCDARGLSSPVLLAVAVAVSRFFVRMRTIP